MIEAAFDVDGPAYDPPYESPIEDAFAWHLAKHLDPATNVKKQVEVDTICGGFRLDFVASAAGRSIGIECDGAEYHDEFRDECRDAVILSGGHVDVIYRLRGADLHYRMGDVLAVLAKTEPSLFGLRGCRNIEHLARGTTVRSLGSGLFFADRPAEEDERPVFSVRIKRHSLESPFLRGFAGFALRHGFHLDAVIAAFLDRAAGEVA